MGIFDLFQPPEVRAALATLEIEINAASSEGGLFLNSGFTLAAPAVRDSIRKNPGLVKAKISGEKMAPRTLVYLLLVNHCGMEIDSGRYHSGFGGLLMPGTGLAAVWNRAADELEKEGIWTADDARQNRETFRNQCA